MSGATARPAPEKDGDDFDEETVEDLKYVRDNYDGVVSEAARMMLQSSDDVSNE